MLASLLSVSMLVKNTNMKDIKQGTLYLLRSYLFILSAQNKYKTFLEHIWQSDKDLLQSSYAHQKNVFNILSEH